MEQYLNEQHIKELKITVKWYISNIEARVLGAVLPNLRLTRRNDFSSNYKVIDSLATEI